MAAEYEAFVNRLKELRTEAAETGKDDGHGGVAAGWAHDKANELVKDLMEGLDREYEPPTAESTLSSDADIIKAATDRANANVQGGALKVVSGNKKKNNKKKGKKAAESMDTLRQRGNAAFKSGDFADAITAYTAALDFDGSSELRPALFSNRSVAFLKNGDALAALADADNCLREDANFIKGYGRKACALLELHRWDDMEAVATEGLKRQNGNQDLRKYQKQARQGREKGRLAGAWTTQKMSPTGSMMKMSYTFNRDGTMIINMMGNSVEALYEMDCGAQPYTIRMNYKGQMTGGKAPPPVVYIFKVDPLKTLSLRQHTEGQNIPTGFDTPDSMSFDWEMPGAPDTAVDANLPIADRANEYAAYWMKLLKNCPKELNPEFAKANADRKPTEKELEELNFRAMEWQGAFVSMRKKYGDDVHAYVLSSMDNGYFKDLKLALANTCGYEKPSGEKLRSKSWADDNAKLPPPTPVLETPMMAPPPTQQQVHHGRDDNLSTAISQFRNRANIDRENSERKQSEIEDRAAFKEAMKEDEEVSSCFGFMPTCIPRDFLFLLPN